MMRYLAVFLLATFLGAAPANANVGEDGLHKQDWFSTSFRDIAEDIAEAKAEGKRLVIIFEQRGCIYCRAMHETLFSDPEVSNYIKANFKVIQYNMFGDEEVTDTDGEVLSEKTAARKWGYIFTPTLVFLPEIVEQGKSVPEIAVSTMPGAFKKWTFLNMFKWVREKGYKGDEHFQKYHARIIEEMRAEGKLPPSQ